MTKIIINFLKKDLIYEIHLLKCVLIYFNYGRIKD